MINTLWRIYHRLDDYKDRLKWAWQRAYRGYDDTAYWGLNTYITDIAIPVLKNLSKNKVGCPMEFFDQSKASDECEQWSYTLDEMLKGFEAYNTLDDMEYFVYRRVCTHDFFKDERCDCIDWKATRKREKELYKVQDKGLKLFAKYFSSLWD